MRAKEFILEYATIDKPNFMKVSSSCGECHGTGNIMNKGSTQTCPSCCGAGSQNDLAAGSASDMDSQMNMASIYTRGGL